MGGPAGPVSMFDKRLLVESRREKFACWFDSDVLHPGMNHLRVPPFNRPWSFQILVDLAVCIESWVRTGRPLCAHRQVEVGILGRDVSDGSRDVGLVSCVLSLLLKDRAKQRTLSHSTRGPVKIQIHLDLILLGDCLHAEVNV